MRRRGSASAAVLAGVTLLLLAPAGARAQSGLSDVIRAGRAHGAELSPDAVAWLAARGDDALEFRHAWKRRAALVQENRAAFEAAAERDGISASVQRTTTAQLQRADAVLDGTFRMPILLGQPSGASAPHAATTYAARMFGAGSASVYSLTSLYQEMSRGVFDLTGDVIGWVPLPNNALHYYTAPAGLPAQFGNTYAFMQHTVAGADASVDFGLYDNDGPDGVPNSGDDDGFVDVAAFMFPAAGRECNRGALSPGIWAHRWSTNGWTGSYISTTDPSAEGGTIRIGDYIIQGGHDCDGSSLQQIGVVAHEMGHAFGIPDLYDTDACDDSGSCQDGAVGEGVGHWDLMGAGNWNRPASPAHMSAHTKSLLGWIDVVTVRTDTALTIGPVLETNTAYRVNTVVAGQYFLLENRQPAGSDVHLASGGLLIWHVDSTIYQSRRQSNSVNNVAAAKGLDLEEADGLNELDGASRGDAGDPWPGSASRTTFDATSAPSSARNGGAASGIAVTDIVATAGADITLRLDVPDLFTFGDVDGDGAVSAADVGVVGGYVVGVSGADYSRIGRGDVDADGDVDARDAFIIQAFVDGVGTSSFRVGALGME